jgi:hypothetical protein
VEQFTRSCIARGAACHGLEAVLRPAPDSAGRRGQTVMGSDGHRANLVVLPVVDLKGSSWLS